MRKFLQLLILLSMLICEVAISGPNNPDVKFANPDFSIVLPKNSKLEKQFTKSRLDINEGKISFNHYSFVMPSGDSKIPVPIVINSMSLTKSLKEKLFNNADGQRHFLADFVNSQQSSIGIPVKKINEVYKQSHEIKLHDKTFQTYRNKFPKAILDWYVFVSPNKLYTVFTLSPLTKKSFVNEKVNKKILESLVVR